MPTLHMMIGIPASGKSAFIAKNPELFYGADIVSRDIIRNNLEKFTEKEISSIEIGDIAYNLSAGHNIVLDNVNATSQIRAEYISRAKALKYDCIAYYFETDIKECEKRDSQRLAEAPFGKRKVGRMVIRSFAKRLQAPKKEEGFSEIWSVRDGIAVPYTEPDPTQEMYDAPASVIHSDHGVWTENVPNVYYKLFRVDGETVSAEKVKKLKEEGVWLDYQGSTQQWTLLCHAVERYCQEKTPQNVRLLNYLLYDALVDPDANCDFNIDGVCPLSVAIENCDAETVEKLLRCNASPNNLGTEGRPLLELAFEQLGTPDGDEIVRLMYKYGANPISANVYQTFASCDDEFWQNIFKIEAETEDFRKKAKPFLPPCEWTFWNTKSVAPADNAVSKEFFKRNKDSIRAKYGTLASDYMIQVMAALNLPVPEPEKRKKMVIQIREKQLESSIPTSKNDIDINDFIFSGRY